jgi:Cd2+/Zn2+-exporting ATPase
VPKTQAELRIHGLDCAEEVGLIRRALDEYPGVHELNFDVVRGKMLVHYDEELVSLTRIQQAVTATGLRCEPWSEHSERSRSFLERHARVILTVVSGVCLIAAIALQALAGGDIVRLLLVHDHEGARTPAAVPVLSLMAIAAGAVFVLPKAWWSFRRWQPDMNALVTISLVGAVYLGEWLEGATLSFLFALAGLLETYSLARARKAVTSLMEVAPGEAMVVHHDHEHKVPVERIKVGARVRVRPGERIPCDGTVVAGTSDVNQAMITGESLPVHKTVNDTVFAGTMNGDGVLEIKTTKTATDTTLARIIRMVEGVQHRRAPSEQFVEKFSRYYTPAMMLLALLVVITPPLLAGGDWGEWFYHGMVILLISCPCALVISTPVSIVAALASSARHGVLVKGGAYLEEAGRLKAIAFDKTGVLTRGEPQVRTLIPLNGRKEEEVLARLAGLESHAGHPLGRAIVAYARQRGVRAADVAQFKVRQGRGAEAEVEGERFWVGSLRMMAEKGLPDIEQAHLEGRTGTVVACGTEQEAWGLIVLSDPVRGETRRILNEIRELGIERVVMLTGDNADTATAVARETGVDDVQAELLPEGKVSAVEQLRQRYERVAMVGDGVNDAQAMATANVGIAMGGGTLDVVLETADVVLMSGDLEKLPFLLKHARRTLGIIRQNVGIALALKAVFLVMAGLGMATLWMAVAADMGATLLVTFNGLRLLRG